jgi:hypothetical protein
MNELGEQRKGGRRKASQREICKGRNEGVKSENME